VKRQILRLTVAFGVATGLLTLLETVAYAEVEPFRIGLNHSEPQR
jgi:hypothetical protein